MSGHDWRGLGLICLPYVALGAIIIACILVAWFEIHV